MARSVPQIALLMRSLTGGGAERVMLNLALGLAERGIHVDILATASNQCLPAGSPKTLRLIHLQQCRFGPWSVSWSQPGVRSLIRWKALVEYIKHVEPPVLLSAMHYLNEIAILAVRSLKTTTKCVVAEHTTLSLEARFVEQWQAKFSPWLVRWLYPLADQVVAVSHGVAHDLALTGKLDQKDIQVLYNPVLSPEIYRQAAEPVEHLWLQPGQPPVILGLGRFVRQKNFALLLQAFALVVKEAPHARLMLVGGGRERAALENLAKELMIVEQVEFLEFVPNPAPYLKQAHVLALTSSWEGLPTVLIEALAIGCPIVSTDCPSGPRELLENGRGTLVPVESPEKMAQALLMALSQPRSIPDQTWLEQFSIEQAVNRYAQVLGISLPQMAIY